jgi:hypothetical protein
VKKNRQMALLLPVQPSSPGRTRTSDLVINSHPLYRLSYRGIPPLK